MLPQEKEHWIEWAAYNLAAGISDAAVRGEMLKNGFEAGELDSIVRSLTASYGFKAALRLAHKYALACALNEALLQLESQVFSFSSLRRVSGLSSRQFHADYYSTNRPVIIEDVVPSWPAMTKWDADFFRTGFGGETVVFQHGRSPTDHRDAFVEHSVKATFSEFLDIIEQPQSSSPAYLIAHDRLLDKPPFKPLLDDIHFDPRYLDGDRTHTRVFFWMGGGGSATPMHRDLGNVYLAQIRGTKLIRMVPSKQLHLMYNEVGYHSEADFDRLSLTDYPLLRDAHIIEETIKPGDLLFIPVGWWHFVKSTDVTITITGNNFCFPNELRPIFF